MSCSNAVCVLEKDHMKGVVTFHQCANQRHTAVTINFKNMKPGATHAIHVHQMGDLRDGCASLGPHWNPTNDTHGSMEVPQRPRHSGDLINNFTTNSQGRFSYNYEDPLLRLRGPLSVVGRSVVVHVGEDDLGLGGDAESLRTGNAGHRLMCGVIGWAA
jgi:Cu-Zn family superoxide dismutase